MSFHSIKLSFSIQDDILRIKTGWRFEFDGDIPVFSM